MNFYLSGSGISQLSVINKIEQFQMHSINYNTNKYQIYNCITQKLMPVSKLDRTTILAMEPTEKSLRVAENAIEALRQVEFVGFDEKQEKKFQSIRVGAWNLQQCHFPEETAKILHRQGIDLALLTEIDVGLRRSNQKNTIAQISKDLGQGYTFAVEFLELTSQAPIQGGMGDKQENRQGFHGNGFTSGLPATRPIVIRLNSEADWFVNPRRGLRRIGGRIAVASTFCVHQTKFVAVSVHLESDTDSAGRARQMDALLRAVDDYAGDLPVIIGGDFNTGARHPKLDYSREALFKVAKHFGYDWRSCNCEGATSRISNVPNANRQNIARFDWFFNRGLTVSDPSIIEALDDSGRPVSDHDLIALTIKIKG